MPFLLVLALLILDFGVAIDRREVLQNAVREGGRAGSAGETPDVIRQVMIVEADGLLSNGDIAVCYEDDSGNGLYGDVDDRVVIQVDYDYEMSALGSGILGAFSALPAQTISINPDAEALLLNEVTGVSGC